MFLRVLYSKRVASFCCRQPSPVSRKIFFGWWNLKELAFLKDGYFVVVVVAVVVLSQRAQKTNLKQDFVSKCIVDFYFSWINSAVFSSFLFSAPNVQTCMTLALSARGQTSERSRYATGEPRVLDDALTNSLSIIANHNTGFLNSIQN